MQNFLNTKFQLAVERIGNVHPEMLDMFDAAANDAIGQLVRESNTEKAKSVKEVCDVKKTIFLKSAHTFALHWSMMIFFTQLTLKRMKDLILF